MAELTGREAHYQPMGCPYCHLTVLRPYLSTHIYTFHHDEPGVCRTCTAKAGSTP